MAGDFKTFGIGTLRGPSAVGMARMMADAAECGDRPVEVFDEPVRLLARMACGDIDFAAMPTSLAGALKQKGFAIAAVMVWGGLFLCGKDAGVSGVSDLKGRTVHVMAGHTPPEMMLRHLLLKSGTDPSVDVRFDTAFPTHKSLAQAALEGKCDFCVLSEPFVSMVLSSNAGMKALVDLGEEWRKTEGFRPPVTSVFCKETLLNDDEEAVREFTGRLRISCEWAKSCPDAAAGIVSEVGLFADTVAVRDSIARTAFEVVEVDSCRRELEDFLLKW